MINKSTEISYKHLKAIQNRLSLGVMVDDVKRLDYLPSDLNYITWSLGPDIETDYSYKIENDGYIYYCTIVTILSLFIIRVHCFRMTEEGYETIN